MDGGIFFNLKTRTLEKRPSRRQLRAPPAPNRPLQLLQADPERSFRHAGAVDLPLQDRSVVSILIFIAPIQAEPLAGNSAAPPPCRPLSLGGREVA